MGALQHDMRLIIRLAAGWAGEGHWVQWAACCSAESGASFREVPAVSYPVENTRGASSSVPVGRAVVVWDRMDCIHEVNGSGLPVC